MRRLIHALSDVIAGDRALRKLLYDLVVDVVDAFDADAAVEIEGKLMVFEQGIVAGDGGGIARDEPGSVP